MEPSSPPQPYPPPLDTPAEPALRQRSLAASALFHAAMLAALLGLWRSAPPPEELPVRVTVVTEGPGAAGTAGASTARRSIMQATNSNSMDSNCKRLSDRSMAR